MEMPVFWGDQDAFGHVNNLVYLGWAETARVDYLIKVGLWEMIDTLKIGPILASISCNYRKPVTYPDTVRVGTRVTRLGNSSFGMEHRIVSVTAGAVVAEVDSTLVVIDYRDGRPTPVPQSVRQAIEAFQASGNGRAG